MSMELSWWAIAALSRWRLVLICSALAAISFMAPKVWGLVVAPGVELMPQLHGGGQERGAAQRQYAVAFGGWDGGSP